LTVSIENQTIALCIDARLSGDVTNLALQQKSYEIRLCKKANCLMSLTKAI